MAAHFKRRWRASQKLEQQMTIDPDPSAIDVGTRFLPILQRNGISELDPHLFQNGHRRVMYALDFVFAEQVHGRNAPTDRLHSLNSDFGGSLSRCAAKAFASHTLHVSPPSTTISLPVM